MKLLLTTLGHRSRLLILALLSISIFIGFHLLTTSKPSDVVTTQHTTQSSRIFKKNKNLRSGGKTASLAALGSLGEEVSRSLSVATTISFDSFEMSHSSDSFNALRVYNLFTSCKDESDIIILDCYIDAYEELCKLFRLFGTIFSFVSSDVEEKIAILREFRKSNQAEEYKTIQSMLEFEVQQDMTRNTKKPSGAGTLLRLHRAMQFISALLLKLRDTDSTVEFSSAAIKAYDDTLAKHHPWLVKKAVHVAMYMLPSRSDLLKKMGVEDNERGMKGITDLAQELNAIYDVTEAAYSKDNLLDLP